MDDGDFHTKIVRFLPKETRKKITGPRNQDTITWSATLGQAQTSSNPVFTYPKTKIIFILPRAQDDKHI